MAEDGYKAGEFDFLQVLIARRTFFDTNLEFVVAQVDLAKASAMLDGQVLSEGLETSNIRERTAFPTGAFKGPPVFVTAMPRASP